MYLRTLTLNNYRNYIKLELKFNSNLILFIGKNAQGKTNILESIFLSCTGRSHRTNRDKELIRWGSEYASVRTMVEKDIGSSMVEIVLSTQEKKKIKINGMQAQRLGELMGQLNGVIFSPEDLRLIKEGPMERRRFMDMELSQMKPQYFYYLQQYNHILNQRNNLLKEAQIKPSLKRTLPIWNEQLAEVGGYITYQRGLFAQKLLDISREIHNQISFHSEDLIVEYKASVENKTGELKEIQENFLKHLEKSEEEDLYRGNTGKGSHRDDLILKINDVDVRTFGSQGQQRTVALSLKLAELKLMHEETGEYPILLLDDVMSELDQYRKKMLLEYLDEVQTLVTTTDLSDLPASDLKNTQIFEVSQGEVFNK